MKPGTRCECRDWECARRTETVAHGEHSNCGAEAVRMVTVEIPSDRYRIDVGRVPDSVSEQVPMCEACAAWHEARQRPHGAEARCDVCNKWKPRDEVRLVTAAQAAGTETWACEECRDGGR